MRIDEIIKSKRTLSFEVFPPKKDGEDKEKLLATIDALTSFSPDFISVTYGAGGSNSKNTVEIADYIQNHARVTALAHITGGPSSPETVASLARSLRERNIENVLCLRGDKPVGYEAEYCKYFAHATDLAAFLAPYGFTLGAACYPEGHPEAASLEEDLKMVKLKTDSGVSHLVTQLFFDNATFYDFRDKAAKAGITATVSAGIMPITNTTQVERIVSMCGVQIPTAFSKICANYQGEDLYKAGIDYAIGQIRDLIDNGVKGIHLYTMNKGDVARAVFNAFEGDRK